MKYVVILGDGMAGYPLPDRDHKTCMQLARTPFWDALAKKSVVGLMRTVPTGFAPGSDVANLSVLGYDPVRSYTGRSPLEAASIGIPLKDTDVTLRCNLVTLSEDEPFAAKTMLDYSAGEISTAEAKELIEALKAQFDRPPFRLYAGISYRHCLVEDGGRTGRTLTPPHDITGKAIAPYLPAGEGSAPLLAMMERSCAILKDHPVNVKRRAEGKNPANSAWFWGAGTRPALPSFEEKTGVKGAMISAVDLLKGIAAGSGMHNIIVEGANGGLHTNYAGKARAAVKALTEDGYDFVYVHIEAPDEMGHQGSAEDKIKAIEYIDDQVIGPVADALR